MPGLDPHGDAIRQHEFDDETIERVLGVRIGSEDHVGLMTALAAMCRRIEILERLFNDHSHTFTNYCHRGSNRSRTKGPSVPKDTV